MVKQYLHVARGNGKSGLCYARRIDQFEKEVKAMTVEETLCNIARNNTLIFTEEEQDAMVEAILAVQELKWYREQDLIRRDDADNILYDEPIMGVDGTCYGLSKPSIDTIKERLADIQKAEPLNKYALYNDKPIVVHNEEDWDRFQADINRLERGRIND